MTKDDEFPPESLTFKSLFFSPSEHQTFAPRVDVLSTYRLSWYTNIGMFSLMDRIGKMFSGRLIGISLLHGHFFPLNLCRHVIKFLLGGTPRWHDLAFFDIELYENLRKLLTLQPGEIDALELKFEIVLRPELGGAEVALVENGSNVSVTADCVDLVCMPTINLIA
jgi:hypothetical protein